MLTLPDPVYKIDVNPVAPNGSCAGTGGPLNPNNGTIGAVCNPSNPQVCPIGDLSGRHGSIVQPGNPSYTTKSVLFV